MRKIKAQLDRLLEDTPYQKTMLVALNRKARGTSTIYAGTVPWDENQKRRRKGKPARKARRLNRR